MSDKRRSQLLAKEERTDTDKKRERRSKKRRQAAKARSREQKERQLAAQPEERRSAAAGRRLAEAQLARAEKRGLVSRVGGAARQPPPQGSVVPPKEGWPTETKWFYRKGKIRLAVFRQNLIFVGNRPRMVSL